MVCGGYAAQSKGTETVERSYTGVSVTCPMLSSSEGGSQPGERTEGKGDARQGKDKTGLGIRWARSDQI